MVDYTFDWEGEGAVLYTEDYIERFGDDHLYSVLKWAKQTIRKEHGFKDVDQIDVEFYLEIDERYLEGEGTGVDEKGLRELGFSEEQIEDLKEDDNDTRNLRIYLSTIKSGHLSVEQFARCNELTRNVGEAVVVSSENDTSIMHILYNYGDPVFLSDPSLTIHSEEWNSMIEFLGKYGLLKEKEVNDLKVK